MSTLLDQLQLFHFIRPWWLLGMIPITLLVVLLWRRQAAYGNWQRVISPNLLPHLMKGYSGRPSRAPLMLLLVCWLLACIAMAGPTWRKLPQAVQKKVNAQVIVLDLSLSMYSTDLEPSRLIRARMKLTDILHRTHEGLTALVVYAGTAHVVTPLTDDTNTILSMVNALSPDIMPVRGSDPVAAIKKALQVLKQGGLDEGRILLITDGVPEDFASKLEGVVSRSTPVSILGVGTTDGAPIKLPDGSFVKDSSGNIVVPRLPIDTMKEAARELGGRFSTLSTTDDDINYLLADTRLFGGNEIKDTHREFDNWDEAGPWLVVLLLPFAAAGYRRGWLGALLMPLLISLALSAIPRPAAAFGWSDLWRTPDQQAQELLQKGNPKEAAKKFQQPDWKATSYYKDKNYKAAAKLFGEHKDADSQYNLGNALAREHKFDEAIAAYQSALKQNPKNEDATFNLKLVKKLKQQQQKQQNNKNGKNGKNDDKNQDKQNNDKSKSDQQKQKDNDQNQKDKQDQDKKQNGQDDKQKDQQDQKDQQNQNGDKNQSQQDKQNQQQQQQSDKDKKQEDSQQEKPEQAKPQNDENRKPPESKAMREQQEEKNESQQALEQWLRRIPDDPGGLLRRKFEMESQLRKNQNGGDSTW